MSAYPVRVHARLDEPLSRGLWLVKWVLAIPHYLVLGLLWIAFPIMTVIAFFAILFTGRYPRSIFEFTTGVLRWTWRVAYYSYGGLGTDRYPPFTLGPAPDYPATLEIDYPGRLSRGLVLVKWWLLAIPHYLVVAVFTGGGVLLWREGGRGADGVLPTLGQGGLIGLLVLIAAVTLLFTGSYPRPIHDLVTGMNRWTLRVAAYAALLTDAYPPFRLDTGEHDPAGPPAEPSAPPAGRHHTWSAGAIVAVVLGSLCVLSALGTVLGGAGTALAGHARGPDGFLDTEAGRVSTPTYAITIEDVEIEGRGVGLVSQAVGQVRVQVGAADRPLFVGVARQRDVVAYLSGVSHDRVTRLPGSPASPDTPQYVRVPGSQAAPAPRTQSFWDAQASGPGRQTLTWEVRPGDWAVVIMNADASAQVSADVRVGATLPVLEGLTTLLLVAAAVLFVSGAGLIGLGVRLATVRTPPLPAASPPLVTGSV